MFALYNYFRSSASYRVRIALNLKGIQFEYRAVHLLKGEQHSADYAKVNPSRELPSLIHNGKTIAQSMAIIDYLDHVAPEKPLFPKDPYKRALVMQACEIVNSGAQPPANLRVLKRITEKFGMTEEQKAEWSADWAEYGLKTLEEFLKPHAGDYCFGNEITAADCFVMPHFANADRWKVSIEPYPTLAKIKSNLSKLDPFRRAAPDQQPDFPPPQ